MRYIVLFILCMSMMFASIQEGQKALDGKKYDKAYSIFMQLIQDAADAKYNLGYMYELGLGVPRNMNKAIRLYRIAAAEGSVKAQVVLGNAYFNGIGVKQNIEQAIDWFELASGQGDEHAKKALNQIDEIKGDMGELIVYSNISNSEVYINNRYRGNTPLTIKIPAGNVLDIIVRREGYSPFAFHETLNIKEHKSIKAQLVQAQK